MNMKPGLYKITGDDSCAGAKVRLHFINRSGNADCRFAEDFGPHRAGEIVVVLPKNLAPIPEEKSCGSTQS